MNLSRLRMNGVSRPCVLRSSTTWLSANASASRLGGVSVPTGTLTITVAFGANDVPGTLPVTTYEPGLTTWLLSVGAGQITRTSGPACLSRYVAGTVNGNRGSIPTVVCTVMSGTLWSLEANGDSFGMAAVEMTGAGAPRRPVIWRPVSPFLRIVTIC